MVLRRAARTGCRRRRPVVMFTQSRHERRQDHPIDREASRQRDQDDSPSVTPQRAAAMEPPHRPPPTARAPPGGRGDRRSRPNARRDQPARRRDAQARTQRQDRRRRRPATRARAPLRRRVPPRPARRGAAPAFAADEPSAPGRRRPADGPAQPAGAALLAPADRVPEAAGSPACGYSSENSVVDPAHVRAQLLAGRLDLVAAPAPRACAGSSPGRRGSRRSTRARSRPTGCREDLLIAASRLVVDDPRAARVVAVLGRVGDRVAHPGQALLVHQVDDQLELVQALEVRHLAGRSPPRRASRSPPGPARTRRRTARPARRTGRSRSRP